MYRGRFAPSPTGDLHLGSAASALLGWLFARKEGGIFVLRVEDIDTPRVKPGVEAQQLDDLRWLGIDWDEGPDVGGGRGPYRQSERAGQYEAALDRLARHGLLYLCDCSRSEIAREASAPHPGEEGPRYSGRCRAFGMQQRDWKRPPAVRLAVPDRELVIEDRLQGPLRENVWRSVGDFVLKRGDGIYAYQLAVVVDDLAMGITEVVRGYDLCSSAPRQVLLAELLSDDSERRAAIPRFAHHAMIMGPDGARLAKRARGVSLGDYRRAGMSAGAVVARLAAALGLWLREGAPPEVTPRELLERFDPSVLERLREVRMNLEM
jgi:glutamyl-tRNA synthetase